MPSEFAIRKARSEDLGAIREILASVQLPGDDIESHLQNFLVLTSADRVVGCVGLEVRERLALLRSLAVAEHFQNQGHGRRLCLAVLELAQQRKISQVFLLTETAERFFALQGFDNIKRSGVPANIQESVEFQLPCCKQAACMRKVLSSRGAV